MMAVQPNCSQYALMKYAPSKTGATKAGVHRASIDRPQTIDSMYDASTTSGMTRNTPTRQPPLGSRATSTPRRNSERTEFRWRRVATIAASGTTRTFRALSGS